MNIKMKTSFKKINTPWITEALEAKFDNAIQLLTPGCKIFGGSLRDLVADLPIEGDLDVLVPTSEFIALRKSFAESPNWILDKLIDTSSYNFKLDRLRVEKILNFKNISNKIVQLIKIKNEDRVLDDYEIILNNIKSVDIRCCGLMLDMEGNLLEVIEGAQQDCKDKALRLNPFVKNKCAKSKVTQRIEKLVKRGWTNFIVEDELVNDMIEAKVVENWATTLPFNFQIPDHLTFKHK